MYVIFQHLYLTWKHVEIYIKNHPKLLFTAVILFGLIWAVFAPVGGAEKVIYQLMTKEEVLCRQKTLAEAGRATLAAQQDPTFVSSNILGTLVNGLSQEEENTADEDCPVGLTENDVPSAVQGNSLLANAGPITFVTQEPRDEVISYVVLEGDVPSTIAAAHGISTYTLLWSNDLNDGELIHPGDELIILPVSGVVHKVKDGDNIGSIAKKYEAAEEDIIAFNDLPADGLINIGDEIVVPDGVMPAPPKPKARYVASSYSYVTGPGTGKSRAFPYGQCTWYVAQKRYVPWNGHAKSWLANAQAMGFSVCWGSQCQPKAGAIASLTGGNWLSRLYGHVVYVESVQDGWFTISEMNHVGWAVKSVRTISTGSGAIAGFIY